MQQNIRFPTSYHNKAVIAEGVKPILPLRWEFFLCPFLHTKEHRNSPISHTKKEAPLSCDTSFYEETISYCHLSHFLVPQGRPVQAGTPIAITGSSGRSTAPHLHLSIKYKCKSIDVKVLLDYIVHSKKLKIMVSGCKSAEKILVLEYKSAKKILVLGGILAK